MPLSYALELFDTTRSPHYKNLYGVLDGFAKIAQEVRSVDPPLSPNEIVRTTVEKNSQGSSSWIYEYDITKVWKERVAAEEAKLHAPQVLPLPVPEISSSTPLVPTLVATASA